MLGNRVGVLLFSSLATLRIAQVLQGSWLAALLALQSALAVWLYFRRLTPLDSELADKKTQILAWGSAILPMAISPGAQTVAWLSLLPVPGLLLSIWAMISLDRSFSIAPAKRALVRRGPYHLIRHPMYAGEILSLIGAVLAAFSVWNSVVLIVFSASIIWRIYQEEALLESYALYRSSVSWRFFWRIW